MSVRSGQPIDIINELNVEEYPAGFSRREGELYCEDVAIRTIIERFGTPAYVYSLSHIASRFRAFRDAVRELDPLVCFAIKSNSNLSILKALAAEGAGFDIVSGGELVRVLRAVGTASKVVFSGVGKTRAEVADALRAGVYSINIEGAEEADQISAIAAEIGVVAPVSVRVNPNVDPKTHPYISTGLKKNKFGVPQTDALQLYRRIASDKNLRVRGIACHIGSQLTDITPLGEAFGRVLELYDALQAEGINIEAIDIGGGLGIRYTDEAPPDLIEYGRTLARLRGSRKVRLVFEPGRFIVGNSGVLLTRVITRKPTARPKFIVVDAAMNDLIRPSLYDAYHRIEPVIERPSRKVWSVDIVGPICESGDFLGKKRKLAPLEPGDGLAVFSAGAYGFVMASNYNTRPRGAEVLVAGSDAVLARRRETLDDLLAQETLALPSETV